MSNHPYRPREIQVIGNAVAAERLHLQVKALKLQAFLDARKQQIQEQMLTMGLEDQVDPPPSFVDIDGERVDGITARIEFDDQYASVHFELGGGDGDFVWCLERPQEIFENGEGDNLDLP